jgi:DNA-binding NtrC family response regulator
MTETALVGRRILLVEDELLVAMLLESILEEHNCTTVGPYADLSSALAAAQREAVDAAVLDINLAGQMVFPVAEALAERGVPFLLLSGYGAMALPPDRGHWPVCNKPFKTDELISLLTREITAAAERQHTKGRGTPPARRNGGPSRRAGQGTGKNTPHP